MVTEVLMVAVPVQVPRTHSVAPEAAAVTAACRLV